MFLDFNCPCSICVSVAPSDAVQGTSSYERTAFNSDVIYSLIGILPHLCPVCLLPH